MKNQHIKVPSYFESKRSWIKNRSHLRHYNLVKYYLISNVLDILIQFRYKEHIDIVPYSLINQKLHTEYAIPEFMYKVNHDECIDIIGQMEWMGLIEFDFDNDESLILKEGGLQMYETQHFHSIYASLLEANASRNLSRKAVIFAFLSVILSLISFWIKY